MSKSGSWARDLYDGLVEVAKQLRVANQLKALEIMLDNDSDTYYKQAEVQIMVDEAMK